MTSDSFYAKAARSTVSWRERVQAFSRDIIELFHPVIDYGFRAWQFWGPRLNNRALWVAISADVTVIGGGDGALMDKLHDHPMIFVGVVLLNLLTPLTPKDAPHELPAPGQFKRAAPPPYIPPAALPSGGLVNPAAFGA